MGKKPGETWRGNVSQEVKTRYERKTYDKALIRIRQDGKDGTTIEQIKAAAEAAGISVNQWIIGACRERMERESRADGP